MGTSSGSENGDKRQRPGEHVAPCDVSEVKQETESATTSETCSRWFLSASRGSFSRDPCTCQTAFHPVPHSGPFDAATLDLMPGEPNMVRAVRTALEWPRRSSRVASTCNCTTAPRCGRRLAAAVPTDRRGAGPYLPCLLHEWTAAARFCNRNALF